MDPSLIVRQALPGDFERVGELTYALLAELYPELGYDRSACIDSARLLLTDGSGVWSFLATTHEGRGIGVVTLNECAAIYAGGRFGEISELYVEPGSRSRSVGALLTDAAARFGRERGWPFIEVGAPSVPTWQRTVDFYLRYGFEEVGPRLYLKLGAA
jgi:GNAT superfamily N-acetyltransferase